MFVRRRSKATTASHLSLLDRSLRALTAQGSRLQDDLDLKGPLGLSVLFEPSEPLVELIFVHGLRGGSRKTWSKTDDPYHYWPREWLSRDPDFKYVRIHSYGYNSDWAETRQSFLNTHDFGKSLLGALYDSPLIRNSNDTPILLVGHSMGGLVIKKMYILARHDTAYEALAKRVQAIIFLATPHRGSDSAQQLTNILKASVPHGSKAYVGDLEPGSGALQSINEDFRHYSNDLQLRSFYEALKTQIGMTSTLIVDKESATLGYPNEKSALLNASHRGICKFDAPSDPNYITLRNSIVSCVDDMTNKTLGRKREYYQSQMRSLQDYLGVRERPEDDLIALEDARMPESCQWFMAKQSFRDWRDVSGSHPRHYWLSAKPATGKSILAGAVVENLEDLNVDCSYYFFRHNDTSKSTLSGCLKSLAFQMALINVKVRQKLLDLIADDVHFEPNDDRVIWRKIFVNGIFQTERSQRPQYWVIDALDECSSNHGVFISLLAKAETPFFLRVFITSRPSNDFNRQFSILGDILLTEQITVEDTLPDIRLYIQAGMEHLPLDQDRTEIIDTIVNKSSGCFLWVVLVLEELRKVYTQSDIVQVLKEVPPGMESLYQRTLKGMSETVRSKTLIKAILVWVVCAMRPLTVAELASALSLDSNTTVSIQALENSITSECGQLVYIDRTKKVQMVHQTIREYLLYGAPDTEFGIKGADGHALLASTCLQYLNSEEMRPPRNQLLIKISSRLSKRSTFLDYACNFFNSHFRRTHSGDDTLLALLNIFLTTNVLCWIEAIAMCGNLSQITRTAKDMRAFLNARAKYRSPIGQQVQRLDMWATDIARIVAKFGGKLVNTPSAIYYLIPPFCPTESAIAAQFGAPSRGIALAGLSNTDWDDRLCCVSYGNKQAVAIGYAEKHLAIALSDKSVTLYYASTFQEFRSFYHLEPIKLLAFSPSGKLLACSGRKRVQLWDLAREESFLVFDVAHEPLLLLFLEQENVLMALTRDNTMYTWEIPSGNLKSLCLGQNPFEEEMENFRRPLTGATCSADLGMSAVVYRGRPICLYDLNYDILFGYCSKESVIGQEGNNVEESGVTPVLDLVFNLNPDVSLLAAAYIDGDLALYDPCELTLLVVIQADATVLMCSPNGRTLATGSSDGTIQLYEFETLRLLYRFQADDYAIRAIAFSSDSLRFIDVRGAQSSVWEPSVLVRNEGSETESMSDTTLPVPKTTEAGDMDSVVEITTLVCHENGKDIFCGKDDGSVSVYDTATGKQAQTLYQHVGGIAVLNIAWGKNQELIATVDASSSILLRKLVRSPKSWHAQDMLLDTRLEQSVSQLMFDLDNKHLLASTAESDTVWDLESRQSRHRTFPDRRARQWTNHPSQTKHLLLMDSISVKFFRWDTFEQLSPSGEAQLDSSKTTQGAPKNAYICGGGKFMAIALEAQDGKLSMRELLVFDTSMLSPGTETLTSVAEFRHVSAQAKHVIGTLGSKLLFLDHHLWVCSLNLVEQKGKFSRHFFLPDEWVTTSRKLLCQVTSQGSVVFVRHDAIAMVHRGLKFEEVISGPTLQRPRNTLPLLHNKAQSAPK